MAKDTEKKEKKEKKEKAARVRWFSIILYPDNEVHCDIIDFLDKGRCPFVQGFYIKHEPDYSETTQEGEKKEHWHVVLHFQNPRTVCGVQSIFGGCYVQMKEDGTKRAVLDSTGLNGVEWEKHSVSKALISTVSDIHSYSMYLLHKTYAAIRAGKKEYQLKDCKAFNHDTEIIPKAFDNQTTLQQGGEMYQILNDYIEPYNIKSIATLVKTLYLNGETTLLKYVESHAYLIKNLL